MFGNMNGHKGLRLLRQSPFKKKAPTVFITSRGHQLTQVGAVVGGTPSPFANTIRQLPGPLSQDRCCTARLHSLRQMTEV